MAVASGKSFIAILERSGIVAQEEIDSALESLDKNVDGQPSGLEQVKRHLVDSGLITEWHCEKLSAGKYKGFFLGKYKLLRHLGSGGMSTVYLAENKITGQKRAIKVLPRKNVNDKSFLERFYREARAAAALNHPNIVRVYDISAVDKTHYMVMEYVEGIDLYEMVKQDGPLPFEAALDHVRQAANGLQHAHDRNLVHRDIKPANLLLSEGGTVKILDLGLALLAADDEESLTVMHNERVMGTADYLSPEQAVNSHEVDHRTDIYSLGCTLYFLLTGQPPFPKGSLAQRIAMHQTKEPEALVNIRQDCPDAVAQFCRRMMQKQPEDRFPAAATVISEIDSYLNDGEFPETGSLRGQFDFDLPDQPSEPMANSIVVTQDSPAPRQSSAKQSKATKTLDTSTQETQNPNLATRKKTQGSLWISLASLSLLVVAIVVFAIFKFAGTSDNQDAAQSGEFASTGTDKPNSPLAGRGASWNSFPEDGSSGGGKLSGNNPGLTMADLVAGEGKGTAKLITFESEQFHKKIPSKQNQVWTIRHNQQEIGTLGNRGQAKVTKTNGGGHALHIFGDSERVVFKPTSPSNRLRSIEFTIKLENDTTTRFMVQAKSLRDLERWKTVYNYPDKDKPPLSTTEFTPVKIDTFGTIDAQKFRFKLDGPVEDGVFIDNLKVGLAQ